MDEIAVHCPRCGRTFSEMPFYHIVQDRTRELCDACWREWRRRRLGANYWAFVLEGREIAQERTDDAG